MSLCNSCSNCSLDLYKARIRYNWHLLGPLKQISRSWGLPQEVIEAISSHIAPTFHIVTSGQKQRGIVVDVTMFLCRLCLATGITRGLSQHGRLPFLRCHTGYFMTTAKNIIVDTKILHDVIYSNLPMHYSCSYYRTRRPIIRKGNSDLITSL